MKNVFIILSVVWAVSCTQQQAHTHQHHRHGHAAEHAAGHTSHAEVPVGVPTELSVYNVDSDWTTQTGDLMKLQHLQGKVQLVAMVYASCQYACPRIVADMKRIESAVAEKYNDRVGLVLISIDPERDTPEKLKAFAEQNHLDVSRWRLLHGSNNDILELAALLGVQYKRVSDTDFSHSNAITVLNPAGEIIHQQVGLGVSPDETITAIQQVLAKQLADK